MNSKSEQRKLAAIMFTDMVGYTALTQRNERLALELLEEHRRLLREFFPKFNGREIETTGDGFLVEFASALEAARCAIEIQRALATRNIAVPLEKQLHVRIGIHVGDVVQKDGKLLGDGVNIAARLQPLAEPGGICISVDVARQVQHNLEATVVRVGKKELKNVKVPMEICRIVLPRGKAARTPGGTSGSFFKEEPRVGFGCGVDPSLRGHSRSVFSPPPRGFLHFLNEHGPHSASNEAGDSHSIRGCETAGLHRRGHESDVPGRRDDGDPVALFE